MMKTTDINRRKQLIAMARAEFVETGLTKNISAAFRMFAAAHPSLCVGVSLSITSADVPPKPDIFADHVRPSCKKCGAEMYLNVFSP